MVESLKPNDKNDVADGTKVCHFLQGTKIIELESVANVVHVQLEKYEKILT